MLTIATDILVLITYAFAIPITSKVPQSVEIQLKKDKIMLTL
jgi:hypothetical protein